MLSKTVFEFFNLFQLNQPCSSSNSKPTGVAGEEVTEHKYTAGERC